MNLEMKQCTKCGECKPVDGFYRHSKTASGYLSKCKTCTKRDVRENRAAKIDYYKAYDVARGMRPDRVAMRAEYQKTEAGKAALARATRGSRKRRPAAYKANCAVNNAVRDGRLNKAPCEVCGNAKAHGHHDDYNKPLEVRWLCTKHHSEWHKHNSPIYPTEGET